MPDTPIAVMSGSSVWGRATMCLTFWKHTKIEKKLKNCLQMFQSQWKGFGLALCAICYSGTFSCHVNKYNQPVVSPCTINGGSPWTGSSRPSHDSERTQHCLRNPHLITQNAESQMDCMLHHEQWLMLICFSYII